MLRRRRRCRCCRSPRSRGRHLRCCCGRRRFFRRGCRHQEVVGLHEMGEGPAASRNLELLLLPSSPLSSSPSSSSSFGGRTAHTTAIRALSAVAVAAGVSGGDGGGDGGLLSGHNACPQLVGVRTGRWWRGLYDSLSLYCCCCVCAAAASPRKATITTTHTHTAEFLGFPAFPSVKPASSSSEENETTEGVLSVAHTHVRTGRDFQ